LGGGHCSRKSLGPEKGKTFYGWWGLGNRNTHQRVVRGVYREGKGPFDAVSKSEKHWCTIWGGQGGGSKCVVTARCPRLQNNTPERKRKCNMKEKCFLMT